MHSILSRPLAQLAEANPSSGSVEEAELTRLLEDENVADDDTDKLQKPWEDLLVGVLNSEEMSPAELNQKRKQLTFKAFQDPLFVPRTLILDFLMEPCIVCMSILLERSSWLTKLSQCFNECEHRILRERLASGGC